MINEIKIKSDKFDEAVRSLKLIGSTLDNVNKKLVNSGNSIGNTWEGKSGENFISINKKLCENINNLSESINTLADQLKNVNEAFEETDRTIMSKVTI